MNLFLIIRGFAGPPSLLKALEFMQARHCFCRRNRVVEHANNIPYTRCKSCDGSRLQKVAMLNSLRWMLVRELICRGLG